MNQFAKFTDSTTVTNILQQQLPWLHGNVQIADCRILHLHYKTYLKKESRRKDFLAATYELQLRNRVTGKQSAQTIFAKMFLSNVSREVFNRAARQPLVPTEFGPSVMRVDEPEMVVWAFPNDPVLHRLPQVIDPAKVKNHLPYSSFPAGFAAKEISSVNVEIINYRPEIRCTARYRLSNGNTTMAIFGKSFAENRGAEIFQRLEHLWKLSQQSSGEFLMPRPLAYNAETETIWQEELAGQSLAEFINDDNFGRLIAEAAKRLAFVHRSQSPTSVRFTPEDHLQEVRKKAAKLSQAFPAANAPLMKTIGLLEQRPMTLPSADERVIHGDFHLRQLMVRHGEVALFDFDEFAIGDPAQDLANFIADLHSQSFDKKLAGAVASTLIDAYGWHADWQLNADRFNWHLAIQFVTRAYRAYLQQKPNLETLVSYFSDLAYQSAAGRTHIV